MADVVKTISELQTLFANNTSGDITPQDLRDLVVSAINRLDDSQWLVPAGGIIMWAGLLADVPVGWALCDGTGSTPDLRDKFIYGWTDGVDPGGTGGSITFTPAGSVSAPTFTGSALGTHSHAVGTLANSSDSAGTPGGTLSWPVGVPTFAGDELSKHSHGYGTIGVADHAAHTHSVTSNVAVGDHKFTQPTIAWPVGVPTISGIAVSDHAAHTHSVTSNVAVSDHTSHTHTYTDVVNHVHVQTVNSGTTGGLSGYGVDTSTSTPATSGYSTANPTGGVASGTTAGPNAALAHSVTNNAVTSGNPSATLTHTVSSQGTVAWPVGVPTAASGAVDAHSVTNNAVTSGDPSATLTHSVSGSTADVTGGTASGTVSWPAGVPTFSGSALGTHTHTVGGSTAAESAGTPAGSVSAPTFTGSSASALPPYFKLAFIQKTSP